MMSKRKKREEGFTLIELIMVIVILGIISAVAIPKFIGLSSSARLGAARGVGAAISSTIQAKHSAYLINGTTYDDDAVIADTSFSGGITVTTASDVITFTTGPDTFKWNYADNINDVAAYITEDAAGSAF